MINQMQVRRSMLASINRMRTATDELQQLATSDVMTMQGTTIGAMRDEVDIIIKTFFEFTAYWNVYNTHNVPEKKP